MNNIQQRLLALEVMLNPPAAQQKAELTLEGPDGEIQARYPIDGPHSIHVLSAIPRPDEMLTAHDDSPGEKT